MNLPGPTRKVPKHIEDELILGAELDKAKARIAELEEALRPFASRTGFCSAHQHDGPLSCHVCYPPEVLRIRELLGEPND